VKNKHNQVAAILCLMSLTSAAFASEATLPNLSGSYTNNSTSYMLALNDTDAATKQAAAAPLDKPAEFQPRFFTMSKAHQYLGLGTVLFMGLTAMTAPDDGCENNCVAKPRQTFGTTHTRLARTAAKMAIATVATGLIAHWDDFHLEDGFSDPDNQHVMLGATGAALMLYAVHKSATSTTPTSHAGLAELGGAAMLVAIKLTW
jgi:hypothetical protein